jgi:hypothetical protein
MEMKGKRAGDRIDLEIPIEVAGTDCSGCQFFDRTRTVAIGRHGGKIGLERKPVSHQEVTICCVATGRKADACIVGLLGTGKGIYFYGVKFLGEADNIWDFEFPPLTEPEGAIGRIHLECIACTTREVIGLTDFELEVLEVNGSISRSCKVCREFSLWQKSSEDTRESETPTPASSPTIPAQRQERRHEPRRGMQVMACIRTTRLGQDLVKTRDVSRRGLSFASPWEYVRGEAIEVAVPYSAGGGNIYLSARIVRLQISPSEGTRIYGVAFLQS